MSVLRTVTKPLRDAYDNREELKEKAKDLPLNVLQTALSGVGHVLLLGDRVRSTIRRLANSEDEETYGAGPAAAERLVPVKPEEAKPPRREPIIFAPRPEKAEAPKAEEIEPAEKPEPVIFAPPKKAPVAVPEPERASKPEVARKPEVVPEPEAVPEPPIPGYADLTVPSLRARMRGKSAEQIGELLAYEKATTARDEVVRMYENRVAKLTTEV